MEVPILARAPKGEEAEAADWVSFWVDVSNPKADHRIV